MINFKRFTVWFLPLFIWAFMSLDARLPQIDSSGVIKKMDEIFKAHATYKELNPTIIRRTLTNYIEELDPTKTYLTESDISVWINPTDTYIETVLQEFKKGDFRVFYEIHETMVSTIQRRHDLEKRIDTNNLPKHVKAEEFKNLKWAANDDALLERLSKIKSLQNDAAAKLNEGIREKTFQRIAKNQLKFEEEVLTTDLKRREQLILSNILKATTASLDAHTSYFTPDEASQFMINVQQRLFGIGAQLRDDVNGFSIVKVVEGGPAERGKELKAKDRIIAVDGEPVVGMDITSAVELIRGAENTPVVLTIIRDIVGENKEKTEEKLDITITRGEVVLKESRYETSFEPYGDGVIAYIKLYSFYQDPEHSSATDINREIEKLKKEHNVKGLIFDLRYNSGGMLSQAVDVTGLFIKKGVVVGIRDNTGAVQYLRNLDPKMCWDGPMMVLINRASASASEIVAQCLKDYGRALIVGDDHSYGKGTFQTFTLNVGKEGKVNPQGEYKVTRGIYYTVSGKTPQMTGVISDIIFPGSLIEMEIGEKFAKFPLENNSIKENFDDDLRDVPYDQRGRIRSIYKFDMQPKLSTYEPYVDNLRKNSELRVANNENYQNFLKEIKKQEIIPEDNVVPFGMCDLQLIEAYSVMKDLILLMQK